MRREARQAAVLWAMAALGMSVAALGWIRCPMAALYHIPCPGCGMTRALVLLATGDVAGSLRMHPLAVPALAAGIALTAAAALSTARSPADGASRPSFAPIAVRGAAVVYAATLLLWVLRWFGLLGGPVPV
jgi:hypothetical protein